MIELIPLLLFVAVCLVLVMGYPVALSLGGTALGFAAFGIIFGVFDPGLLMAMPERLYGIMINDTLIAVPLFILMGVILEKSNLAQDLLRQMGALMARLPGGLGLGVVLVGALLAASTGIVGATVVAMGMMSLPTMMRQGYCHSLASGLVCATGTLGQIVPPSIALVLLGDVLSGAWQEAQLRQGIYGGDSISVGDLFVGALVPGLILVVAYLLYVVVRVRMRPQDAPAARHSEDGKDWGALLCPILLMVVVLGSIIAGLATPTEAAGVGSMGATLLALWRRRLNLRVLRQVARSTMYMTSMVFFILIGASLFSLVFRGFGGEELVHQLFGSLGGNAMLAMLLVMAVVFLLGFILDFIEIIFVVVPIVGPALLMMGIDPLWLGIMLAVNLQTSFLTPPFGFALFYLRGVAPPELSSTSMYRGVAPFVLMQLLLLVLMACFPGLITWLPGLL